MHTTVKQIQRTTLALMMGAIAMGACDSASTTGTNASPAGAAAKLQFAIDNSSNTAIMINPHLVTLHVGSGMTASATVVDANGNLVTDARPTFYSTSPNIATVEVLSDGKSARVEARAPGLTGIVATYGGVVDTLIVTATSNE